MKNSKQRSDHKFFSTFFSFFNKWFFVGIIFILFSCIFSLVLSPQEITGQMKHPNWVALYNFCIKLIPSIFQTLGISFMLGAIFDFSKTSQGFTEFISSILSDIVISKSFLTRMEDGGKREALNLILRPSENQVAQYSRIDDYFEKKISDSMKMWDTNFKTNTEINIRIRMNKERTAVETVGTMSYRIYKVKDSYIDILTTFERPGSYSFDTKIIYPGGVHQVTKATARIVNTGGCDMYNFFFKVPEELYQYRYLTIEKKIFEPGFDHWTNFHWTALTPYDGLIFHLYCEDDLIIKEHIIFDEKQLYNVTISDDRKEMNILSTDWLDANTGFTVTISNTPF